jgi:hypothetical protein
LCSFALIEFKQLPVSLSWCFCCKHDKFLKMHGLQLGLFNIILLLELRQH